MSTPPNTDAIVAFKLSTRSRQDGECIVWTGGKNKEGYGLIRLGDKREMTHRAAYILQVGQIPKDKVIDHLCRNPSCINVEHMELVCEKENILRGRSPSAINHNKTHCVHGHEFNESNTWESVKGKRHCRECNKLRLRGLRERGIKYWLPKKAN